MKKIKQSLDVHILQAENVSFYHPRIVSLNSTMENCWVIELTDLSAHMVQAAKKKCFEIVSHDPDSSTSSKPSF